MIHKSRQVWILVKFLCRTLRSLKVNQLRSQQNKFKMSKLVENYLLQEPIGKGVYGQVYKAVHQKSKELFAVKVIPKQSFRSNPKLQQLAINQINILSSLKHQNIVRFVQTLKTPNNFYFVYEYCNEGTLQNLLQKRKFLKQNEALIIFRQLLQAFKELNKNNIMHRDLKPDNIFMRNGRVKLGDFGFCKMLQVNMAQTMLGSPIYMAPEILRQEIYTSKADIWSLGVVLFELLFGYCPFESSSISQLINVIKQNQLVIPKEINFISQKVQGLLKKMLVKDQFKRIEWVDLFEYRIDEYGNIVSGFNKEMGIEALEKYFLNDVKSAGEIVLEDGNNNGSNAYVNPYLEFKSEEIGSEKTSGSNTNTKKQDEYIPSLKKVNSNNENSATNPLLKSQSLGKAGPGPNILNAPQISQFNFKMAESQPITEQQLIQKFQKRPSIKQPTPISSFYQKHSSWSQAIDLIQELSQKPTAQNDRCIFYLASSLIQKLNFESKNYPEWTDVIMQQKEQVGLVLKELEHLEVNREFDKKNQMLKMWSKGTVKGDRAWDKAVRFMFYDQRNANRTVEQILLS